MALLQDVLDGEPRFPLRTWSFTYAPDGSFSGELWSQHEETLGDYYAWLRGQVDDLIVIAGSSDDCPWLDEAGRDVEAAARRHWELRHLPWLKLPPYDEQGTRGWTVAVEAAGINGEWRDVTGRDAELLELVRILEIINRPEGVETMAWSLFRRYIKDSERLRRVACRVIAGEALSAEDEAVLAVGVSPKRVRELKHKCGYDALR